MSLMMERIAIVSSNSTNLCALLSMAEEHAFLRNCMSPEAFQECIAGDSNMTRVRILCEKVIQELITGNTKLYDSLCEYLHERSDAYWNMYLRFTAIGSTKCDTNSNKATSELLHLQTKVKELTAELLHLCQTQSSADGQSEEIGAPELAEERTANEDADLIETMEVATFEPEHEPQLSPAENNIESLNSHDFDESVLNKGIKEEATIEQPCPNDQQLSSSSCREEISLSIKEDANDDEQRCSLEEEEEAEDGPEEMTGNESSIDNGNVFENSFAVGETPFMCQTCGMTFARAPELSRHLSRSHIGMEKVGVYACEMCKKTFIWKRHLVKHVRLLHEIRRPFACELCDKKFSIEGNLLNHVRIHTGEMPFSCDTCGMKFKRNSFLIQHVRVVHTKEKSFVCVHCGRSFEQMIQLTRHSRVHTIAMRSARS